VFANLLNNAAKYTGRGGRISVVADLREDAAVVRVQDTGIGIPAEQLRRIFEMFVQVDRSLERAQGGLGIGLTLVKRLVEMHGGTVQAFSGGEGRGSEFVVRLPVVNMRQAEPRAPADVEPAVSLARRKVLVVDDNEDSAKSLSLMLELLGHEIRTAHDGLEALDIGETFRPDVVLLDLGMPRLNGYAAAGRIREREWGRSALLVALTGWGQDEDRRRTRQAGFDEHLVKPADLSALTRLLSDASGP
jgi:CheY-like chemotaxis protein